MENSSGGSRKWIAAVASIWIQCSCGGSYAFGIYSPVLKSSQGYDQSTLDTVSVSKDIGANAGVLSGLLYAAVAANNRLHPSSSSLLPTGPWVVHLVGAIQCFVGYFFMWLSVTGIIPRPHVALMCLFLFLAAHAQTFFNTANVVTAVHNFPGYSGTIVGIMKGFLGLSGAILIQIYLTLFEGSPTTFLLILAILPTLLSVLLMFLVRIDAAYTIDEKNYLDKFSGISLIVAAYLMVLIILENQVPVLPPWSRILTFVVLVILLSSPVCIALKAQSHSLRLAHMSSPVTPLIEDIETIKPEIKVSRSSNPLECHQVPSDTVQNNMSPEDVPTFQEEIDLFRAMRTMNFWLLFLAMVCGMGSGLATINNISQIGESLGYTTVETSALVSLWSIWNFLGRFGAGYVSDIFLHKKGWARPLFMTLTLAAMTAGHVVIASGFPGNLYIGSVLVGVCYGSQWSLMPTITSELFGVLNMGTIFNTIAIASPVGSYILSVRLIGFIYDKDAYGTGKSCYGKHCFMLSFFILASVSLFGFLVAMVLFFRTRMFYSHVLLRRLGQTAEE